MRRHRRAEPHARLRGDLLRVAAVAHEIGERRTVLNEGLARWTYEGRTGYGISEYLHQLDADGPAAGADRVETETMREITSGLQFPEGPIAMPDGSVLLVEIRRGTLSRVAPDGTIEVVAETGGGPNGAADRPRRRASTSATTAASSGTTWAGSRSRATSRRTTSAGASSASTSKTGTVEDLYTACDGHPLRGPNDIVFDATGGFWFTDHGKIRERDRDRTGVFYARPDGSMIREVIFPLDAPERHRPLARRQAALRRRDASPDASGRGTSPARARSPAGAGFGPSGGTLLAGLAGLSALRLARRRRRRQRLRRDAGERRHHRRSRPTARSIEHVPMPDPLTTNICFGGPDLRTAYVTLLGHRTARGLRVAAAGAPPRLLRPMRMPP